MGSSKPKTAANAAIGTAPVRRSRVLLFIFILLIITAAFAVLTFLVITIKSFPIDLQISTALQSVDFPVFKWLMIAVSWPGFLPQSAIITGLIIMSILGFGLQWEALIALIAAILPTGLDLLVKGLIQRPRPVASLVHVFATLPDSSFPSGHVMYYTGFFGFIVFLAFTKMKPSWKRTVLLVFFGLLVLLVGISRIYTGEHWASDVLGAYLLGSLTLAVILQLYCWGKPRFFVHLR